MPEQVAAIRLDAGKSSWRWDDFSFEQVANLRCFGGVTGIALTDALTNVMAKVGNEWVQDNFDELKQRVADFLAGNID
jgi:hypothetical protein